MPYVEGGWPGSNPKDVEFFKAARGMRWQTAKLAAFGSTRHRSNRAEDDPNLRELVAAETPVVTIFGKSWLLHVTEVLGATPQENLDMIADSVRFIVDRGRELVYDAEHFFDGYKADRDYALSTLRAAREAGRPDARPVRHERRDAHRRAAPRSSTTSAARSRRTRTRRRVDAGASTPTTTPRWPSPTRWRRSPPGIRHVQATINGYGERAGNANMVSILANLALKTPHELVPAGGGDLAGPHRAQPVGRRDREPEPQRLPAVRRPVRVRPQGRRPRRGGREGRAELPAHRPDRRRQPGPARRQRARRPGQHPDPGRAARPPARRRRRPARSSRSSSRSSRTRASRSRARRRASSC